MPSSFLALDVGHGETKPLRPPNQVQWRPSLTFSVVTTFSDSPRQKRSASEDNPNGPASLVPSIWLQNQIVDVC